MRPPLALIRAAALVRRAGPLLLFAAALGAQSSGQPPLEACKPGDFTVLGYPDEFGPRATPSFDVLIDKRFDGQFLTQQKIWLPVIVDAIAKWNGVSGSKWRFNNLGMTDKEADPNDNRVTIAACGGLFACPEQGPPSPPRGPGGDILEFFPVFQTTVAVTLIYEDFSPGRAIRNSDIFFNPAIPFAVDPSPGQIDFETVLLHELGHSLGLDHNDNCVAGKTVMESLVGLNERKRALSSSELEGVRFLYPADTASSVRVKQSERRVELKAVAGQYPPFPVDVVAVWAALPPLERDGEPAMGDAGAADGPLPRRREDPDRRQSRRPAGRRSPATVSISDDKHAGPPATVTVALTVSEAGVRGDAPLLTRRAS